MFARTNSFYYHYPHYNKFSQVIMKKTFYVGCKKGLALHVCICQVHASCAEREPLRGKQIVVCNWLATSQRSHIFDKRSYHIDQLAFICTLCVQSQMMSGNLVTDMLF